MGDAPFIEDVDEMEEYEIQDRDEEVLSVAFIAQINRFGPTHDGPGMPEMHKVDEEALPLINMDGLKEMYVLVVGARRKPHAAIC
ncbi:hypothetical protein L1987_06078 [Smallanthus sonchifolius]|uniref:Uncharacterized protein n=1 Tax=Smallanthus sonchifolius TaxID=185202 RepID=A0ACB9JXI4_9ASTR|nr:hypothetical protein L1987_06078 [Smallanthus sonchifolius]